MIVVHLVDEVFGECYRVLHEIMVPRKEGAFLSAGHFIPVLFSRDADLNMLRQQLSWTNEGCSPFH